MIRIEVDTGFEPVYTALQAAASPLGQSTERHNTDAYRTVFEKPGSEDTGPTRADDETRTRDPHLGKVMRYQLRYIRISRCSSLRHLNDFSRKDRRSQNRTAHPGVSARLPLTMCIGPLPSASIGSRGPVSGPQDGRLAQLVARFLHTEEVISSSLVSPTAAGPGSPGAFPFPRRSPSALRRDVCGCARSRRRPTATHSRTAPHRTAPPHSQANLARRRTSFHGAHTHHRHPYRAASASRTTANRRASSAAASRRMPLCCTR